MRKNHWNIVAAAIGLIVLSLPVLWEAAAAARDDRVAQIAGHPLSGDRLAQAAPDANKPPDQPAPAKPSDQPVQPAPAVSAPAASTATAEVARPAPTVPGCALRYMAAELAGKLKGRKWKEFREAECGPSTTQAVFPVAVAPKYAGENPDKARTLTCADQFNANKTTNGNGGMKWIEKSGGYYSECVVRLKG
jgi:hypothetical protein